MTHTKNIIHLPIGRFFIKTVLPVTIALTILAGCSSVQQIRNPYATVDWEKYGQHKANLHTHTMVSDGWMNPHTVVEKYREAGYQILAISDHNSVTWPWTEFSKFEMNAKNEKRITNKELKPQEEGFITPDDLVFKDVNPSDAGMVAIQGNELSSHHHMNSFFNDHNGTNTEIESLNATAAKNGLTVLNHPGRYHETNPKHYSLEWYLDLFKRYNHLLGMEVYNCGKRFPHDDMLWDSILTVMAPVRPVWGFSNDDMHSLRDFGRNWNVFPLPELNEQEVRQAMENGTFYFVYAPDGHRGSKPPVIESIKVDQRKGKIRIDASGSDSIVWIAEGKKIMQGNRFVLKKSQGNIKYVRAELYGVDDIVVCTQPFFIEKPK
ncbi:MAG: hypothetical protein RBS73_02140 [Prolixibacteraceae bacterium]|jgi:hypothetical protein|nr:hypothetical protein [Prolixibacteraceae bacterium]